MNIKRERRFSNNEVSHEFGIDEVTSDEMTNGEYFMEKRPFGVMYHLGPRKSWGNLLRLGHYGGGFKLGKREHQTEIPKDLEDLEKRRWGNVLGGGYKLGKRGWGSTFGGRYWLDNNSWNSRFGSGFKFGKRGWGSVIGGGYKLGKRGWGSVLGGGYKLGKRNDDAELPYASGGNFQNPRGGQNFDIHYEARYNKGREDNSTTDKRSWGKVIGQGYKFGKRNPTDIGETNVDKRRGASRSSYLKMLERIIGRSIQERVPLNDLRGRQYKSPSHLNIRY